MTRVTHIRSENTDTLPKILTGHTVIPGRRYPGEASRKMALWSSNSHEDHNVVYMEMHVEKYLSDYVKYLLENNKDGIQELLEDTSNTAWKDYVGYYAEQMKEVGFGLNPSYVGFVHNKEVFARLLEEKKAELIRKYPPKKKKKSWW